MEIRGVVKKYWGSSTHIAPIVTFRVVFGLVMALSMLRFWYRGWIEELYIDPEFYFSYLGFDWVTPVPAPGMYLIFAILFLSALGIASGLFYRTSAITFFLLFTYVELLDKTNYLNHYYFVSIISFILIFLPAAKSIALDIGLRCRTGETRVPRWTVDLLKLQLGIVYFFAGFAKLNVDWLFHALPLKIWLPSMSHLPLLGAVLEYEVTAYIFSWIGAVFDLSIFFLLLNKTLRPWAYIVLFGFHFLTALLFPIGVFPFVMMSATLIFFSPAWHIKLWKMLGLDFTGGHRVVHFWRWEPILVAIFISFQLLVPMRYLLYSGDVFWSEEGYRFSWRVMLMEKAGNTTFFVEDDYDGKREWVDNSEYLTQQQIKMMSTQPDMILQFAHFLDEKYRERGYISPAIFCFSKVSLNGRLSRTFIDPKQDLSQVPLDLRERNWVINYE